METPTDPKPKRKYVMTPEHRAKVLANLAQARLAPKEKVYRKTPKRYAANLNNLGIAAAKRRQEREILSAKMEELFPPPEVPPPLLPRLQERSGEPPRRMPPSFFLDPFAEATRLIGKRLRKVHAAVRREGRRIMRLLTAALNRSQPLSVEEARNLVCQLLKCLDGTRVTEEARRLNDKIGRLLGKMIEVRYGVEPGGVPMEIWLEQLREDRRARAAAARERRAARRAERAQEPQEVRKEDPVTPGDTAEARPGAQVGVGPAVVAEDGNENAGCLGGQRKEPRRVSIPELPETWEEFQSLVTRALRSGGRAGSGRGAGGEPLEPPALVEGAGEDGIARTGTIVPKGGGQPARLLPRPVPGASRPRLQNPAYSEAGQRLSSLDGSTHGEGGEMLGLVGVDDPFDRAPNGRRLPQPFPPNPRSAPLPISQPAVRRTRRRRPDPGLLGRRLIPNSEW